MKAGLEISRDRNNNKAVGAIEKLEAIYTNSTGKILLKWKHAENAQAYKVYIKIFEDAMDKYTLLNCIGGRQLLVQNLVSGKRYNFKVVPVFKSSEGMAGNAVSQIAA